MGEIEMQAIQLGEMKHASKGLMRIPCFFVVLLEYPNMVLLMERILNPLKNYISPLKYLIQTAYKCL